MQIIYRIGSAAIIAAAILSGAFGSAFRAAAEDDVSPDALNDKFISLLKEKTPSWKAAPAVITWWEAKAAKEEGNFALCKKKLEQAVVLIDDPSVKKIDYDEILKFAGAEARPAAKGKLQPPQNGAYTGIWLAPLCSPLKSPKGTFDQMTACHSAIVFDVAPWHSYAGAYDYDLRLTLEKARYLSWDDLFSFENSVIINPIMTKQIQEEELPLILTFRQHAELLARYGSVLALSWIAGYVPDRPDWQGGEDYSPENIKDRVPKIQDILDGKWDDYIRKIAREVKEVNAPLLMELTHEFNAPTFSNNAWWSFGKNGSQTSMEVCNPGYAGSELSDLQGDIKEMVKLIDEGKIKTDCPELYNQYKSPYIPDINDAVPDGAERMRDMWIHVKKIFDEEGAANVAWFEHTGDSTGTALFNKVMPWNKIDYYWPGKGHIDFIGTSVYYADAGSSSAGFDEPDSNKTFHAAANLAKEVEHSEYWKDTPVLLVEFAYMPDEAEEKNIGKVFGEYMPRDFKNVKGFTFLDWPPQFGTDAEIAEWKRYVSDNPYYVKYPVIYTGGEGE